MNIQTDFNQFPLSAFDVEGLRNKGTGIEPKTTFFDSLDQDSIELSPDATTATSSSSGTGSSQDFPYGGSTDSGAPMDETGS